MAKSIFYFFLFLLSSLSSLGQIICSDFPDCGRSLDSSYTFEKVSSAIQIDTTNHKNQWQIATPHKIILDSALSPTHVLITDSINPIIINNTSLVTLKIHSHKPNNVYLQFHQKYDIDSTHQKAYLECSYDNGNSWILLDNNPTGMCDASIKFWTCQSSDSTANGPFFYGKTNKWITSGYVWEWVFLVRLEDSSLCTGAPDSILVRFVFKNDSVAVPNEGWMIDNIDVYDAGICGGINTLTKSVTNIYPNPADDYISIKNSAQLNYVSITNLYGEVLISKKEQNSSNSKINISSLAPGIYFIQYKDDFGNLDEEKFIKQ